MNTSISTIYGHKFLGLFFRELIEIDDHGFTYHGRRYSWDDIKKVVRLDNAFYTLFLYSFGGPYTKIHLSDGNKIRVLGRVLERKGEKSTVSFVGVKSRAYEDLISIIESKFNITKCITSG